MNKCSRNGTEVSWRNRFHQSVDQIDNYGLIPSHCTNILSKTLVNGYLIRHNFLNAFSAFSQLAKARLMVVLCRCFEYPLGWIYLCNIVVDVVSTRKLVAIL